jgi:hypothetical protein
VKEWNGTIFVECPNIVSSMYAQQKLRNNFGFEIFGSDLHGQGKGEPHFTDRFCVCFPPEEDRNDKPLILYCNPTHDINGKEVYDKTKEWIGLFPALKLFNFLRSK